MRLCLVPIALALAASAGVQARNTEVVPGETRTENVDRRPASRAPARVPPGTSAPPVTGAPPNNTQPRTLPAAGSMNMPPLQPPPGQSPNGGALPGLVSTGTLTVTGMGAQGKRLPETISTGALTAMGIGAIAIGLPKTVTTGPLGATGTAQ